MKETAFLPSFLSHQSKSTVIWCYTGAGYGYKENYKQIINLNRNAIPIIIIFSNAGALVANRYGFFWNLGQTTIEKDLIHFIFENEKVLQCNIKKILDRANLSYSTAPNDPAFSYAISLANNDAVRCIIGSPLTANTTAKLANGIADTFITNLIVHGLKAGKKIGIFPTDASFPEVTSFLPVRYHSKTISRKVDPKLCQFNAIKINRFNQIEYLAHFCVGCLKCVHEFPEVFSFLEEITVKIRQIDAQNASKLASELSIFNKPEQINPFVKQLFRQFK